MYGRPRRFGSSSNNKSDKIANQILDMLKEYKLDNPGFVPVQYIGKNWKDDYGNSAPWSGSKYNLLRDILGTLAGAGVLERDAGNSGDRHRYRLRVSTWDRMRPYAKQYLPGEEKGEEPIEVPETDEPPPIYTPAPPYMPKFSLEEPKVDDEDLQPFRDRIKRLEEQKKDLEERNVVVVKMGEQFERQVRKLEKQLEDASKTVKVLKIKRYDDKKYILKNRTFPKCFDRIKTLAECRRNIMLFGPTGCGKTYTGQLLADVLGMDFVYMSLTAGKNETHFSGRDTPNIMKGTNTFQGTEFLRVFEEGGVCMLDEFDAADANLLLTINTALANGTIEVPKRPGKKVAEKHPDFVCVGTANTTGRGTTREYVGRNQLDEATLDRFRIGIVEMQFDKAIEKVVCPDEGKDFEPPESYNREDDTLQRIIDKGYGLRGTCHYIRYRIEQSRLRRILSTRFMQDAYIMMEEGKWELKEALSAFLEGWTQEEKNKLV